MENKDQAKTSVLDTMPKLLQGGTMTLDKPIIAADAEVTEIKYSFRNMTARQYMDALGVDESGSPFYITRQQALALFCKAAGGLNPSVDEHDLRERMGLVDVANAIRLGKSFFSGVGNVGVQLIKSES